MIGDLWFFTAKGKANAKIIEWLERTFHETGSCSSSRIYTHVAMETTEQDLLIEMVFPSPRIIGKDHYINREYDIFRPICNDIIKHEAVKWCYRNMGNNYRFIDYLTGHLGWKKVYRVCSAWLNKAYTCSGFPIVLIDKLVSPCELASSPKLEKIIQ